MQVQPTDLKTVEVDGTPIPIRGPDCRLCARMATCDIFKADIKSGFFIENYPTLTDETGKPLPVNKQIRPYQTSQLAAICRYYSPATRSDPLSR